MNKSNVNVSKDINHIHLCFNTNDIMTSKNSNNISENQFDDFIPKLDSINIRKIQNQYYPSEIINIDTEKKIAYVKFFDSLDTKELDVNEILKINPKIGFSQPLSGTNSYSRFRLLMGKSRSGSYDSVFTNIEFYGNMNENICFMNFEAK